MNEMSAKQWLSRGYYLRQEKEQLEQLRQETFDRLVSITQNLEVVNASGTKDPHKYDALVDLNEKIDRNIEALTSVWLEICTAISKVPDRRYRIVLRGRYIECMSWEEIAFKMHYCIRHVKRLHGAALDAITPIIKGESDERRV